MKYCFTFLAFLLVNVFFSNAQETQHLWYNQPITDNILNEGLPVGNGHLGAMSDGKVDKETILLNDITMWSGSKYDANKPGASDHLQEIRDLIFAGKNSEAENLVNKYFVCIPPGSGGAKYGTYQLLGNLHIDYDLGSGAYTNYKRSLSLDSAIATTTFKKDGITYHRSYFAGFSDDVIMIKISADQPGKINFDVTIDRPERYQTTVVNGNELEMSGQLNSGQSGVEGIKYLTRVKIKPTGGTLSANRNKLEVKNADAAVVYVSAATNLFEKTTTAFYKPSFDYENYSKEQLENAIGKSYEQEKEEHIQAYQKLYHSASIHIKNNNETQAKLPTDERIDAFKNDPTDNGLVELYFNYGRYLLISSTRPGWLPPNLQGLWADGVQTPWNGDYHLNINIQMNHWPLDLTNLSELNSPFYTLTKGLVKPGERTAKIYYNADKGWVSHAITNVWGFTAPGEVASWGSANSGSGWMCNVLWEHYAFTKDNNYLQKIYPILKGSAEFYLNSLVEYPNNDKGWLVTVPSSSPENAFRYKAPDGSTKTASVDAGPTIDNQVIRELFEHVMLAANTLQIDPQFIEVLDSVKKRLPPNQIDDNDRLMEWIKPYDLTNAHHRHMSPLWGVFPGSDISVNKTPVVAEAAKNLMLQRGDGSTGWSLGWKINLWARMHNATHSFNIIKGLLNPVPATHNSGIYGGVYPNMFDSHSPFQIDGNFGGTAGIAEMLIQSQSGDIDFLPALPAHWQDGNFKNLRVRGGGIVSATWGNGTLASATLKATQENDFKVIIPDGLKIELPNCNIPYKMDGQEITLSLEKGDSIALKFDKISNGASDKVTINNNVLSAPVVQVVKSTKSAIGFSWNAIAGALGYQVSEDGGNTWKNPSSGELGTTHIVKGNAGEEISLQVRTVGSDACGVSQVSNVATGTIKTSELAQQHKYFIPNAVIPSASAPDNIWKVYGSSIKDMTAMVFSKNGQKIFQTKDINKGWDGTFKGKQQAGGVYVYHVLITFQDNATLDKTGSITLIR